ncbi:glycosyl hydrolase 53 family protein [Hymenobacter sp. BT186]|uniref:Arabinogalactan endo-beta-1,4-galactanase n=1 Tax=Hymenobacter telluris TaxID=2816474 RepID=A0A939ESX2_9BACT|nr:glycosyl hydrolase 53 family protein [Hymenobacter telluris]MBO0356524.1 glycosyl hydrolase 53 family protein [Hymenobacter telluris]MBW3372549.1 glycosyl hydrolase 53 family protein [Hymenobacter norwichensis]
MKKILQLIGLVAALCSGPVAKAQTPVFAKGADVGWVTEMEAAGYQFYNNAGTQQDLFQILRGKDMNTIRLRVWVNPTGGWNGKADVVAKAIRARNAGFRLLIDFHYSDSWADPGQQTKPAAWQNLTFAQLKTALYNHTYDVLDSLKDNNIVPEWVQVGNETNDGMLWPDGRASTNMANFAQLVDQGYAAVKAVNPTSKVIVHISNGFNNNLFRYIFDGLRNNAARWDVMGMSLYPTAVNWPTLTAQCLTNMNDMVTRYPGKEVMVVETGMPVGAVIPTQQMLLDLMAKVQSVPGNKGLGVLYWEPQAYNWRGYGLGAWSGNGQPTAALDAFLNTPPARGLVYNPGFEYTGPTQQPLGWTTTTSTSDDNADFTQNYGQASLYQLTHSKATAYQVRTSQVVTNLPNGTYTLRAWAQSSGGQNVCELYANGFGGAERTTAIPADPNWVQVQITGINVTNGQCEIGLRSNANAGNTCGLDDVELVPTQVMATTGPAAHAGSSASVFPNPAHRNFTVEYALPQDETVQISLHTLTGQLVQMLRTPRLVRKGLLQESFVVPAALTPGVYLLKIVHGDATILKRISLL